MDRSRPIRSRSWSFQPHFYTTVSSYEIWRNIVCIFSISSVFAPSVMFIFMYGLHFVVLSYNTRNVVFSWFITNWFASNWSTEGITKESNIAKTFEMNSYELKISHIACHYTLRPVRDRITRTIFAPYHQIPLVARSPAVQVIYTGHRCNEQNITGYPEAVDGLY